jgi:hypothetical protein
MSVGLRAVHTCKELKLQIKEMEDKLPKNVAHNAYDILCNQLYHRYGVIAPQYSLKNLTKIHSFKIVDSMLNLTLANMDENIAKRQDIVRTSPIKAIKLNQYEGFHLEEWIRDIVQDRYLIARAPPFPVLFKETYLCTTTPHLIWDITKSSVEIDFLFGFPDVNMIVVGSCKRCVTKVNQNNLKNHWDNLLNNQKIYYSLLDCLKLKEKNLLVRFVHLVTEASEDDKKNFCRTNENIILLSLTDMLDCFPFRPTTETDWNENIVKTPYQNLNVIFILFFSLLSYMINVIIFILSN